MKNILFMLLIFVFFTSCSDDEKKEIDYLENFTGITERNETGELIGSNDSTDWKLHEVDGTFNFPEFSGAKGVDDEIVPSSFSFSAYPNPTNTNSSFDAVIAQECIISIWIIDENGNCEVEVTKEDPIEAGNYSYSLELETLESGLHRCLYYLEIGTDQYYGWGDILKE